MLSDSRILGNSNDLHQLGNNRHFNAQLFVWVDITYIYTGNLHMSSMSRQGGCNICSCSLWYLTSHGNWPPPYGSEEQTKARYWARGSGSTSSCNAWIDDGGNDEVSWYALIYPISSVTKRLNRSRTTSFLPCWSLLTLYNTCFLFRARSYRFSLFTYY